MIYNLHTTLPLPRSARSARSARSYSFYYSYIASLLSITINSATTTTTSYMYHGVVCSINTAIHIMYDVKDDTAYQFIKQ